MSIKLGDPSSHHSHGRGTPGRSEWRNTTLSVLIRNAYTVNEYQVEGGPKIQLAAKAGGTSSSQDGRHIQGSGLPISTLAAMLTSAVGAEVIDRTGLEGQYDLNLEFGPLIPTPGQDDALSDMKPPAITGAYCAAIRSTKCALSICPRPSSAVSLYSVVFAGETCKQYESAGRSSSTGGSIRTDFAPETL